MNRPFAIYGILLILLHVGIAAAAMDPFADATVGDRIPPSQMGPSGPTFVPVGFLGGK